MCLVKNLEAHSYTYNYNIAVGNKLDTDPFDSILRCAMRALCLNSLFVSDGGNANRQLKQKKKALAKARRSKTCVVI